MGDNWRTHAACRGMDTDIFMPERGDLTLAAKRVCAGCSVRDECLAHAIAHNEKGIWGGISERGRRRLKRTRQQTAKKILQGCGTEAGYARHLKNGEPIDEWCQEAHRKSRHGTDRLVRA